MAATDNAAEMTPRLFSVRHEIVRRLILVLFVAGLAAAAIIARISPPISIAVLLLSHAPFWYAALRPNSDLCAPVVKKFAARDREVWLTFDDGPDPAETPHVLELLARHGARATFFLIGKKAKQQPELVRRILAEGHAIGNHTFSHPKIFFWAYTPSHGGREIDRCTDALAGACGQASRLFRAPIGLHTPLLFPQLARRGMQPVGWTVRGFDRADSDPQRIVRRLMHRLEPGAILLLHPERCDRHGRNSGLAALELLLGELDRVGYRCVLPAPAQLK